jgi:hypothetical protein
MKSVCLYHFLYTVDWFWDKAVYTHVCGWHWKSVSFSRNSCQPCVHLQSSDNERKSIPRVQHNWLVGWLAGWLTDWLTVTQLVKKFPAFYGARMFITVCTLSISFSTLTLSINYIFDRFTTGHCALKCRWTDGNRFWNLRAWAVLSIART